ncbi:MAG: RNA-directed polymerase protein [Myxococcaceae bacterium]|nr:RNA-directed polymerase protein [Myxococcaceae bacterium]
MSLGDLLLALKALLVDPKKNGDAISQLLQQHRSLAEYEVARFYVASSSAGMIGDVRKRLRDKDPRVRLDAVHSIDVLFLRQTASQLLRLVMKDPDSTTRSAARHAVRSLALSDVALPDTRYKLRPNQVSRSTTPGAWNPSGWAYGVYRRPKRMPARAQAAAAYGLPPLPTVESVAALVGVPAADLVRLQRPGVGSGSPYVEFEIDKGRGRGGGKRAIAAPRATLRKAQRVLLHAILDKVPAHAAAHGFVKGRGTVTNAKPHLGAAVVVKLDLVDFFPTVHYRRVAGLFEMLGYGEAVSNLLASLCTYRPVLEDGTVAWPGVMPQGAPTSPAIANLVCRRLDARLSALAKRANAVYTRYADDLTFSFAAEPEKLGRFLWWVDQICQQEGFTENTGKRRVLRKKNQQRITGIVVNAELAIPRRDRRRFRAILHNVKKNGLAAEAKGKPDLAAYLRGFAAYVKMVQPELGAALVTEVKAVLANAHP